MRIKINIEGHVEKTKDLQKDVDTLLEKYFKSFTFIWEQKRGIEQK